MVDFAKILSDQNSKKSHPREIFLTLARDHKFEFLREIQSNVLDQWHERRDERDLIIKLNVGSGKTLIGLLILQSHLNQKIFPAVFVCPNKQLMAQVISEAKLLGIEVTDRPEDAKFQTGEKICVTNIYKIFNGKSKFGVGNEGVKIDIGAIVIDDVHSCIAQLRGQFRLKFNNDTKSYKKILEIAKDEIQRQSHKQYLELINGGASSCIEIPFWLWQKQVREIQEVLHSEFAEHEKLKFTYHLLAEYLPFCRCFISGQRIEIEPSFPFTDLIPAFERAKHRIYTTATLADDSVVSTHFSPDHSKMEMSIVPTIQQSMGDRMILMPQDAAILLTREDTKNLLINYAVHKNVVVIVPSEKATAEWKTHANQILNKDNIEAGIDKLHKGHVGLTVLVNRYDGIDLPEESCSILAMFDLPYVESYGEAVDRGVLRSTEMTLI